MKRFFCCFFAVASVMYGSAQKTEGLSWDRLATVWDEAVPLGNGFVGALVWQKGDNLRMSLDRIDLWDLRPTDPVKVENFSYAWLAGMVQSGRAGEINGLANSGRKFEGYPPSKIPGAAIEFPIKGNVKNVELLLGNALCRVEWDNGASMETFVHAEKPYGYFVFRGFGTMVDFSVKTPDYEKNAGAVNSLAALGYTQGPCSDSTWNAGGASYKEEVYHQEGWNGFHYDVVVITKYKDGVTEGVWSVTSSISGEDASDIVKTALRGGYAKAMKEHSAWWSAYWNKSSVSVPDSVIQRQYDSEMYKFGSLARKNGYIIPLQGVWTEDDGQLPPWKGDIHHDLNTQLSYWPAYTGNHLEEGYGFLYTLWNQRESNKEYTREFFGCDGLNVPSMAKLDGSTISDIWLQYSYSPTTSAWLAQHFYLHWKYSMDRKFLAEIGYPYLKDVAAFLENITELKDGHRILPTSCSPEIYDNSVKAWFPTLTNYDNSLMNNAFANAAEMAGELGFKEDSVHWMELLGQLQPFALDSTGGLAIAEGFPFPFSHRHFSNAMAIYPLGILDKTHGEAEKEIIDRTLETINGKGTSYWCGYSFSWMAALEARAGHGEKAAENLTIFAEHFCLPNTFHANGDQTKQGYSNFTYRPFTLEGNMAFAGALQEMVLQSNNGYIELFPAVPSSWNGISFEGLRARGAFLVSASLKDGKYDVEIYSEKGGMLRFKNPVTGVIETYKTKPGQRIIPVL